MFKKLPKGKKYSAFFAAALNRLEHKPPYSVILQSRIGSDWNDFGHRTRVVISITGENSDEFIKLPGFIGFVDGAPTGVKSIQEVTLKLGEMIIPAVWEKYHFYTLLRDMESYRHLVREMGSKGATEVLNAINDLVALNEFKPKTSWLKQVEKSHVFLMSFMRTSDAFFAYRNAGSILRGLENEALGSLSESLAIRFKLHGRTNEHYLTFSFDHRGILPKRVAVVIGKNGVGKSQALSRIAKAALKGSSVLTDGVNNGRPTISRLLAFSANRDTASVFPARPKGQQAQKISYYRFVLNQSGRSSRETSVSAAIYELSRENTDIKGVSRWRIFLSAIEGLSNSEQISLSISINNIDRFVRLRHLISGGEAEQLSRAVNWMRDPVRLIEGEAYPLSSGEISFLRFAALASLRIENGSLVLLDEPETHLHPNFIAKFAELLDYLLKVTGSAAIIATHSVYFVREVFRDQVTVIRADPDGSVYTESPRLRTFGGDVGAISFFVFGEDGPSPLALKLQQDITDGAITWDALYQNYKDELSPEFMMSLRAKMSGNER